MRVLALNYEFPPLGGGAANATAHICRELVQLGCTVEVLTSGFSGLPKLEELDGYRVRRVPVAAPQDAPELTPRDGDLCR